MAVKTNASTALKYPDGMRSGDLKKFKAIASATEQIITLTEDLLILARAENDLDNATDQIDLALLLQQIATKYQPQIDAKSMTLEVAIQPDLWLQGSTNSLDRVFINLLENAIHYTPSGGKIMILADSPGRGCGTRQRLCQRQRIDRQIEIAIIDTGVGIATTDLDRIFDRFWRGDRSRTRWEGGSGLGLAIAKSIVEQHHGSIEVKSKLGEGSQFMVRLLSIDYLAARLCQR